MTAVIAITLSLLLPLSLINDLSALAFTSILGFSAIIYTVIFIIVRALDGSYQFPGGRFLQDPTVIAALPAFDKASLWNFDFTSLVLASNLGLACECERKSLGVRDACSVRLTGLLDSHASSNFSCPKDIAHYNAPVGNDQPHTVCCGHPSSP